MSKEYKIEGCLEVPDNIDDIQVSDALIAFVESKGWAFGGGVSYVNESERDNMAYAFVDGSYNADTKVFGYGGFVVVDDVQHVVSGRSNDASLATMRNVAGEIAGAMAAVEKAEELGLSDLTIKYDYKGIENWVTGDWRANTEGTQAYRDFMRSSDRTVKVDFEHVKAHTGIEGNEMADILAKDAVGASLTRSQNIKLEEFRQAQPFDAKEQLMFSSVIENEDEGDQITFDDLGWW